MCEKVTCLVERTLRCFISRDLNDTLRCELAADVLTAEPEPIYLQYGLKHNVRKRLLTVGKNFLSSLFSLLRLSESTSTMNSEPEGPMMSTVAVKSFLF